MQTFRVIIALLFAVTPLLATAARKPDCSRLAGTLIDPTRPEGEPDPAIPLKHIVILMQENHSFDTYFGQLAYDGYEGQVDGTDGSFGNPDSRGNEVRMFHQTDYCPSDPNNGWDAAHQSWDLGANDGFVQANGRASMGYYDRKDLNYYYALANEFAIGDRYFCSAMTSTYPNRFFLLAGTAFGHTANDFPVPGIEFNRRTIFDTMSEQQVSWRYYFSNLPFYGLFGPSYLSHLGHIRKIDQLYKDLRKGKLAAVTFVDPSFGEDDEEPPEDFQIGQSNTARIIQALMASPEWSSTALILTYDENGGFYDHVPPPEACEPDGILPQTPGDGVTPTRYDHYGFRVPLVIVSPYAKRHYVSHHVYDHTSILKLIETQYNLPALTKRDANADGMLDLFDFEHPVFEMPALPAAAIDPVEFDRCSHHEHDDDERPEARRRR